MLTDFELGWLVGILEGEGCFARDLKGSLRVSVLMCDQDIIERVAKMFSRITGKRLWVKERVDERPNHNNLFLTEVYGPNARAVMAVVVPYMGYRRRQKIWQCLNGYTAPKLKIDIPSLIASIVEHRRISA